MAKNSPFPPKSMLKLYFVGLNRLELSSFAYGWTIDGELGLNNIDCGGRGAVTGPSVRFLNIFWTDCLEGWENLESGFSGKERGE